MLLSPRARAASVLLAASETSVVGMAVAVTLLYSPRLADNLLGKAALVHILGGLSVLLWGLARSVEGRVVWPRSSQLLPFLGFLLVAAVAGSRARNPMVAWEMWLIWAQWLALMVVVADLSQEIRRARRLVLAVLSLSIVVCVIGLLQVLGYDVMSLSMARQGEPLSSLGNTNFVAHYLDVVLPLALAVMVSGSWTRAARLAAALTLCMGLILLLLAGSQGGWLGVGGALFIMLWAVPRSRDPLLHLLKRLSVVIVIVGLLIPVAGSVLRSLPVGGGQSARDVITEIADESWMEALTPFSSTSFSRAMRMLIWRDSIMIVQANPWLGVGPGHYRFELAAHRTATGQREWGALMGYRENHPAHAHNEFVETWSEIGVFGVAMLLWLLGAGLTMAWRIVSGHRVGDVSAAHSVAFGCLGGLMATVVHALFSFNLQDPVSGTHLWILCGLLAGSASHLARPRRVWLLATVWRRAVIMGTTGVLAVGGVHLGLCMLMGDVYFLQSRHHLADGHGNRAIVALRDAVDWRDYEFSYHHWLGQVSLQMKRYDEAAQALARSLELHENNPGAIRLLARALLSQKQGAQAIAPLRHAIEIDGLAGENLILLAEALRQAEQPEAAMRVARQAVSLAGSPQLLVALALDHHKAGFLSSAIVVLEQALQVWPQDAAIVGSLGALQIEAGESVTGEVNLRRALALEPGRAQWYGNLGLALAAQRRFDEALEAARAALRIEPENAAWQELFTQLEALH
jgi:O-antigen ligase/tetratricopeptide (TPR) repeat protein